MFQFEGLGGSFRRVEKKLSLEDSEVRYQNNPLLNKEEAAHVMPLL